MRNEIKFNYLKFYGWITIIHGLIYLVLMYALIHLGIFIG